MKSFSKKLIELFPLIWKGGDPDEGLKEFINYKQSIPVRGAALFNESLSKILLVQGVESPNWSFPRGKISKDEDDVTCAVREVKEEIGFDISPYIKADDYIERTIRAKNYRIYLVKNIPEDVNFQPLVRNEIASIEWEDFKKVTKKSKSNPNKYFLVSSMVRPIQSWIKKNKGEFNENQLKKDVEAQLKFLLGIGQEETPAIDPGRELLDFIRNSTAKKKLKDEQNLLQNNNTIGNLQQHQQQQQQFVYQQQLQNPMPNFGFAPPPFQQLPFINPFAPPPAFINGVPGFPFPQFAPYPVSLPHQQHQIPPPGSQPIIQRAPNPEELSRPSQGLRQRNEQESKELLSILNGKTKAKASNSKELLDLFNKNKNDSGAPQKKLTMLKRDDSNAEKKDDNANDYSKNLLALLNKKPLKEEKKEEPPVVEEKKVEKPKLKLLKREDKLAEPQPALVQTQKEVIPQRVENFASESSDEHNEEDEFYESAPPTKELLDLIKKSKGNSNNDEEFEIFEEFTDEEDINEDGDSTRSDVDEREVEEEIEPEEFEEFEEFDPEYESDEEILNEPVPNVEAQQPVKKQSEEVKQEIVSAPPKKFKLLKRGEDLDDAKPEEPSKPETPVNGETLADNASGTSTIQFSDDSEDQVHDTENTENEVSEQGTQNVNSQASNSLLNLLHKPKVTKESNPKTLDDIEAGYEGDLSNSVETLQSNKGNDLLSLLHRSQTPKNTEYSTPVNDLSSSFLNSLQQKPAPTTYEAEPQQVEKTPSNSLLDLLKKPKQEVEEPKVSSSPANGGGADLLSILHKSKSPEPISQPQPTSTGGADLLNILHGKKSPESTPLTPQSSNKDNAAGADLLSLLHKNKSPETQQSPSTFQHTSGSPANDLLNMLHRSTPKPQEPEQPSKEEENPEEKSTKSNNSFLEFLMRK